MIRMFDITGCDAVMIGRAAYGNPWFFKNALARYNNEPLPPTPSLIEIAKTCERHFDLLINSRGEKAGANLMRKHFSNYIKGFPGASVFRQNLVTALNLESMRSELNRFKDQASEIYFKNS